MFCILGLVAQIYRVLNYNEFASKFADTTSCYMEQQTSDDSRDLSAFKSYYCRSGNPKSTLKFFLFAAMKAL